MSHKTFFGEEIFPRGKEEKLSTFKYKGTDHSILYKYVYGKFAQFLVDNVIPESMAPNLVV